MNFEIKFCAGGVVLDSWVTGAESAGLVGIYRDGVPYVPKADHILRGIRPAYLRKAVARAGWWQRRGDGSDVLRMDLYRKRDGAPMGSLFAKAVTI